MLGNIKSRYLTKLIISYIYERVKLDIIKYNKTLQYLMNINLINYKYYSGKYIIYETKDKGKEYYHINDEFKLIFEGEFLNGKKNGKGKEYNNYGELIFDGEYLNGKRWNGKGREYLRGQIIFEGEYLNGLKFMLKK